MSADKDIDGWFAERGITLPDSRARARAALEEVGLTSSRKVRISEAKLPRAEQVLAERFYRVCAASECQQVARASGKEALLVEPRSHCEHCGGSNNRRAEVAFLETCQRRGVRRVVVVGGSPAVREELENKLGGRIELRMVDGTERRTAGKAQSDLEWGDLVLVWGATELHHKVSSHYTQPGTPHRHKVVHVARRGVAALLEAGISHLER
ncbi:hypothetical protein [Vitiosangium sp. GDMCC 1.1324]|uniref:hypothetical protein n=1 Tax=Vitiosangium sp. (strain GDMCC 1.1324) TaxID=2138576 RepID=UPI000D33E2A2|nr:hypothetical protein [Vitiosangium sp. GDMCC 1.1324]PTL77511.1 hypothetical protein DAT35_44770 [Vitiosangium sp. GDMCC 1.1324]